MIQIFVDTSTSEQRRRHWQRQRQRAPRVDRVREAVQHIPLPGVRGTEKGGQVVARR